MAKRERYMMTVYAETREEQLAVERAIDELRARSTPFGRRVFPGIDRDQGWDLVDETERSTGGPGRPPGPFLCPHPPVKTARVARMLRV